MKKIISILLVGLMLVSSLSVTAFAENYNPGEYLYEDVFLDSFSNYIGSDVSIGGDDYFYSEEYYHHVDENDPNSEIDWVLIEANSIMVAPWLIKREVKNRVFYSVDEGIPFSFGVAIFDVKNQSFHDLSDSVIDMFPDAEEIIFNQLGYGRQIGDADCDGRLTVMDATFVQMVAAKLTSYSKYDDISDYYSFSCKLNYISDMNRDGKRDILDATAIQLALAGLDGSEDDDINNELVYVEYDEVRYPNTYPAKPDDGVALDYEVKGNSNSYNYTASHLGYPENFMAVIKSKEQYDYVFEGYNNSFDEEFFETHWLVASMTHTSCDEEVAKIVSVYLAGETLYVSVAEYLPDGLEAVSPSAPPYISLAAIEKEKLFDVTNIVRVK